MKEQTSAAGFRQAKGEAVEMQVQAHRDGRQRPPRREGLAWSRCTALRCEEAVLRWLHGGSLVQPQHVQKKGADGGTTQTNTCQDNNHPTQPGAAP